MTEDTKSDAPKLLLTRAHIMEAHDITYEDVDVPEWGGVVRLKMWTAAERDKCEAHIQTRTESKNFTNIRAYIVATSIVDPNTNELMFSPQDIKALGEKSGTALERVAQAATKLNKMTQKDLEELRGNFLAGQNGDSTSTLLEF